MMPPYIFRCASVIHTARTSALWGLQLLLLLRQTANGALAITSTTYICILQFLSGRSHNASGLCSRGREVFSVPHSTLWSLWVKPSRYSQYTDFRQKWVCMTWRESKSTDTAQVSQFNATNYSMQTNLWSLLCCSYLKKSTYFPV